MGNTRPPAHVEILSDLESIKADEDSWVRDGLDVPYGRFCFQVSCLVVEMLAVVSAQIESLGNE